ncbi:MAG: GNAT family N-acetyltransferase [Ginsengibacter sp.]
MNANCMDDILIDCVTKRALLLGRDIVLESIGMEDCLKGTDNFGRTYFYLKTEKGLQAIDNFFEVQEGVSQKFFTVLLKRSLKIGNVFWKKKAFLVQKDCLMELRPPNRKVLAQDAANIEYVTCTAEEITERLKLDVGAAGLESLTSYLEKRKPAKSCLIAVCNEKLVGIVLTENYRSDTIIDWIYVLPKFRKIGIATSMMQFVSKRCLEVGQESVIIHVLSQFKEHYEALGFQIFDELHYFRFRPPYNRKIKKSNWPTESFSYDAVLKSKEEYLRSLSNLNLQNLPIHIDPPKNWDSFAALQVILSHTGSELEDKVVLDAGGESYSSILPLLDAFGFRRLHCINLCLSELEHAGNISFEHGDITTTRFSDNTFDYIVCLSVIEHGVDIEKYFKEMGRILKKGGLLITSTDYWHEAVQTAGRSAYNAPVKIFKRDEVLNMVDVAKRYGLQLKGELDLTCANTVVSWMGLDFTFIYFTLEKL